MSARFFATGVALLALSLSVPGCGGDAAAGDGSVGAGLPAACGDGANAYLAALERAPAPVALGGGTTITDCLLRSRGSTQLPALEDALVAAAEELNTEAIETEGGKPAIALGYLLGAVRTAAQETGAHASLVRRLLVASRLSDGGRPPLPQLTIAFGTGFDAGHENG